MIALAFLGLFYALLNAASAFAFWYDKMQAREGGWRLSERTLLMMSLLAWPGAKFGQARFRHKTRKQPFATLLNIAGVSHAGVLGWLAWAALGPG